MIKKYIANKEHPNPASEQMFGRSLACDSIEGFGASAVFDCHVTSFGLRELAARHNSTGKLYFHS